MVLNIPVCFPKKVEKKEFHDERVNIYVRLLVYKYFMVETKTRFSETCVCDQKSRKKRVVH